MVSVPPQLEMDLRAQAAHDALGRENEASAALRHKGGMRARPARYTFTSITP
jgi:hypothetical protein